MKRRIGADSSLPELMRFSSMSRSTPGFIVRFIFVCLACSKKSGRNADHI